MKKIVNEILTPRLTPPPPQRGYPIIHIKYGSCPAASRSEFCQFFSKVNLIYFTNESILKGYSGLWYAGNPWLLLKMSQYLLFYITSSLQNVTYQSSSTFPSFNRFLDTPLAAIVHSFSCAKIYVFIRNVYKDNMNSLINLV